MERIRRNMWMIPMIGILGYIIFFFTDYKLHGHHLVWHTQAEEYYWLFSPQLKNEILAPRSLSYIGKKNIFNEYTFRYNQRQYGLNIWEFKNMQYIDLKQIPIKRDNFLMNYHFPRGETFEKGMDCESTVAYGTDFNNAMAINLNASSNIDTMFNEKSYKAFYGIINKMLLGNKTKRSMILLNYSKNKTYNLFILYIKIHPFFIIIVNSSQPFDPVGMIQIFNLK